MVASNKFTSRKIKASMTRLLCFAAAAALMAVPMSAAAQGADPAVSAFKKICWDTAGDYVQALKSAADDSWTDTQVVAPTAANVSITDKAARDKEVGGVGMTLLVTRGLQHTSGGDVKVSTCKMTVSKADNALVSEGKAWVGTDPNSGDATSAVYFVKPGPGKPNPIASTEVQAAMNAGGFGVLKFQQDDADAILVYQFFSK
jgi:hypothetical protein